MRSLSADRSRSLSLTTTIVGLLSVGWIAWFAAAEVTVSETAPGARLEVEQAAHRVDTPVGGRLVALNVELGQVVTAGEVLAKLDTSVQRGELEAEQARLAAIEPRIAAIHRELAAHQQAMLADESATSVALAQRQAKLREGQIGSKLADEEAARAAKLHEGGAIAELEKLRSEADAKAKRAATSALALDPAKLTAEQRRRASQGLTHVEELRRLVVTLEGMRETLKASMRVLDASIDKRTIRSPIDGKIGELAEISVGAYLQEGETLTAVVPTGGIRAVAEFSVQAAAGRIRPGQIARLRLDGFPWTQYGMVHAKVTRVATEPKDGMVRVELSVEPNSNVPMQHGLPGSVEVDIERVTPASLVFRAVGGALGQPASAREP